MDLMELFANPETMQQLSFGDKMLGSTVTMIMGMGITFMVLCILWAFITIMGKVMNSVEGSKKAAPAPAAKKASAAAPAGDSDELQAVLAAAVAAYENTDEIMAVIAAAIAAYEAEVVTTSNLVVRKIVRIPSDTTGWSETARNEHLDSRRF